MAGQLIDVPGMGKVEFPEGMSDDQIVSAIKKNSLSAKPDRELTSTEFAKKYYDPKRQWGSGAEAAAYRAGGAVTDLASKAGLPPEAAGGAGYLTNVAMQAVPSMFGGQAGAMAGAPVLKSAAERLMQSALKPTYEAIRKGNAKVAVSTMLDEGINATRGGVDVLKGKVAEVGDQITNLIAPSTALIDRSKAAARAQDAVKKFETQVNPNADLGAIENSITEFLSQGARHIPVQQAQALKQGTYTQLAKKYGELKGAEVEAQKAIARGLKEEIAEAVPGVSELNKVQSNLLKTLNVAERRTLVGMNNNPMGLSLLANNPASWAAFMADKSALFKSLAARMVNAGAERVPQAVGMAGGGILGASSGSPPDEIGILRYLKQ